MKRSYYFICACGCGQKSEDLVKEDYIRLREEKWLASGCELENCAEVRPMLGGRIVRPSDF